MSHLENYHHVKFSDGEIQVNIEESVRGYDVYIIQSTSFPVNNHLMELLIMVDACVRASAHSINVVLPYFAMHVKTASLHLVSHLQLN